MMQIKKKIFSKSMHLTGLSFYKGYKSRDVLEMILHVLIIE